MDVETTIQSPVEPIVTVPTAAHEPPQSLGWAFVTAITHPARTAKRTTGCSLASAWCVHALAGLLIVVTVSGIAAWSHVGRIDIRAIRTEMVGDWGSLADDIARQPVFLPSAIFGVFLLIEFGFLLLALVVTPWGARDEAIRRSYRHALRQTWLRTSHAWLIVGLAWSSAMVLEDARRNWIGRHPGPSLPTAPVFPAISPDHADYPKALAEFNAATTEYQRQCRAIQSAWFPYRQAQPWYIRNPEVIVLVLVFFMAVWFVWAYLRALGIDRPVGPCVRPPMCERCGYNLTAMSLDARCPECGTLVAESLGDHVRAGPPWVHRQTIGLEQAWRKTIRAAILKPKELGARIMVGQRATDHRSFIARHLPLIFLIGAATIVAMGAIHNGRDAMSRDLALFLSIGSGAGCGCVIGAIGCILAVALAVGLYYSYRQKRNLLPASIQAAGYGVGFLVIWAVIGGGLIPILTWMDRMEAFHGIQETTGLPTDFVGIMSWVVPNLICLFFYISLVVRATAAARYANR